MPQGKFEEHTQKTHRTMESIKLSIELFFMHKRYTDKATTTTSSKRKTRKS